MGVAHARLSIPCGDQRARTRRQRVFSSAARIEPCRPKGRLYENPLGPPDLHSCCSGRLQPGTVALELSLAESIPAALKGASTKTLSNRWIYIRAVVAAGFSRAPSLSNSAWPDRTLPP